MEPRLNDPTTRLPSHLDPAATIALLTRPNWLRLPRLSLALQAGRPPTCHNDNWSIGVQELHSFARYCVKMGSELGRPGRRTNDPVCYLQTAGKAHNVSTMAAAPHCCKLINSHYSAGAFAGSVAISLDPCIARRVRESPQDAPKVKRWLYIG